MDLQAANTLLSLASRGVDPMDHAAFVDGLIEAILEDTTAFSTWSEDSVSLLRRVLFKQGSSDVVDPRPAATTAHSLATELRAVAATLIAVAEPMDRLDFRAASESSRFHRATPSPVSEAILAYPEVARNGSDSVIRPAPAMADALRQRGRWPGYVVQDRDGAAAFIPAPDLSAITKVQAATRDGVVDWRMLRPEPPVPHGAVDVRDVGSHEVRILHLSDLHCGTNRAQQARSLLMPRLRSIRPRPTQVVLSGDLLDQPKRRHHHAFEGFRSELMSTMGIPRPPVIVLGNHDQRVFGNSLGLIGRVFRTAVNIPWNRVDVDDLTKVVFFCFNSASEPAYFARGEVTGDDLIAMAVEYDSRNQNRVYDDYLKIAVVHHHPYPYDANDALRLFNPANLVGAPETINMDHAERFLNWCAERNVRIVLHGHKHVPRLVVETFRTSDGSDVEMTTVGCGTSLGAGDGPLDYCIIDWDHLEQRATVDFHRCGPNGEGFHSLAVRSVLVGTPA